MGWPVWSTTIFFCWACSVHWLLSRRKLLLILFLLQKLKQTHTTEAMATEAIEAMAGMAGATMAKGQQTLAIMATADMVGKCIRATATARGLQRLIPTIITTAATVGKGMATAAATMAMERDLLVQR